MKLINAPTITVSSVIHQPKSILGWIRRFLFGKKHEPSKTYRFPGRLSFSSCIIEDPDGMLAIGKRINCLILDGYKLYGLLPVRTVPVENPSADSTFVYECKLDYFELV